MENVLVTTGNMVGLTIYDFLLFQEMTLFKSFHKPFLSR